MGMQFEIRLALRHVMGVKMANVLMQCRRLLNLRALQFMRVNPWNRRVPQRERQQHLHTDGRPAYATAPQVPRSAMHESVAKGQRLIPEKNTQNLAAVQ